MCYHITSYGEPMGGMLFVEAGIEAGDREAVGRVVRSQLQELAAAGPCLEELERSRALALQRLDGLDDARDLLVRFDYYRRLARADTSPPAAAPGPWPASPPPPSAPRPGVSPWTPTTSWCRGEPQSPPPAAGGGLDRGGSRRGPGVGGARSRPALSRRPPDRLRRHRRGLHGAG